MPRVADYSILIDSWWVEGTGADPIQFDVPDNIDPNSRCILSFMLKSQNIEALNITIRVNGTPVWDWRYEDDGPRAQFFQEVIPKGLVKAGSNTMNLDTNSRDARFTALSDVVIWWQANI